MPRALRIACLIMAAILPAALCACSYESDAAATPAPTVCLETPCAPTICPDGTACPEPEATPGIGEDEGEYSSEELTGVAGPNDVLPMHDSYEEAKAANDEVIGWITVPGTIIDYPVVRTDNNDYYLGRDVNKEKSKYGAIFMDFRNADPLQQKHIIVYGHNMKNGAMFHSLINYKQRDFFDENRTVNFIWDGVDTVWEIYLAYTVRADEVYHINTLFADDQNFADVMNDTIAYARTVQPNNIDESVTIQPTDQVITLSTCTYEYDNSFFAIMARRIK